MGIVAVATSVIAGFGLDSYRLALAAIRHLPGGATTIA